MLRRDFLGVLPLLAGARPRAGCASAIGIAIGDGATAGEAHQGLRFGLAEAKRTLQPQPRPLAWTERRGQAAATALAQAGVELIVGVGDIGTTPAGGPPVVRAPVSETDRNTCGGEEWLVGPAPEQRAAVLATYRALQPLASADLSVVSWHPALERYGAAQLNERYLAFAQRAASEFAWLGWLAVRVAFEAALRGPAAAELRRSAFAVDAHKGAALRFDALSRRLVQPLYVVDRKRPALPPLAEITPQPVAAVCPLEVMRR